MQNKRKDNFKESAVYACGMMRHNDFIGKRCRVKNNSIENNMRKICGINISC
jgi:hypothetical protein